MVDCSGKRRMFILDSELGGDAVELFVAVVGAQETATDGQRDAVVFRHLHLQVCIVRHRHELREHRPPQDGVVLRLPIHHLELEPLVSEVARLAEDDI